MMRLTGAPFVNLTFDEPNTNNLVSVGGALSGTREDLLPGWTINLNGQDYDGPVGFATQNEGSYPVNVIQNQTGYHLYPYNMLPIGELGFGEQLRPEDLSLSVRQQGEIPSWATGLEIKEPAESSLGVLINDKAASRTTIWSDGATVVEAVSLGPYAGQDVMVEFQYRGMVVGSLDILGFSAIPEPRTAALLVLGGLALWWPGRSRSRSRVG